MAENYMQMLDMGLRHTEQVFGRIDEAVTKSFTFAEQQRQFDAELELRGSQFAAEMAFNDKQLAAEEQKNLMLAENMKIANELDGRRFMAEMQTKPLELEAARIRVEAAKVDKERALLDIKERNFKALAAPIDMQVAAKIAQTNNPEIGDAYAAIRSKYMGEVSQGKPYNEAAFSQEVKDLVAGYEAVEPMVGYNPGVPIMLDSLGATGEAARIRAANPTNAPNVLAMEIGAIMGGPKGWQEYATSPQGRGVPQDRMLKVGAASESYSRLTDSITMLHEDIQKTKQVMAASSVTDKASQQKIIDEKYQELLRLEGLRKKVFNDTLGIDMPEVPRQEDQSIQEANRVIAQNKVKEAEKQTKEGPKYPIISEEQVNDFEPNAELKNKQQQIRNFTLGFPDAFEVDPESKPFGNVDFSYLYGNTNVRKDSVNHSKVIIKNILTNVENVPLNPDGKSEKSIKDLIQAPEFKSLLDKLNNKSVDVPSPFGDQNSYMQVGNNDFMASLFNDLSKTFKMDMPSGYVIRTPEDIMKYASLLDSEYDKELFVKKLYASVIAAGAIDQLSK